MIDCLFVLIKHESVLCFRTEFNDSTWTSVTISQATSSNRYSRKENSQGRISSYQIGSELSEITHFWCLFWYLCFSLHQTLIWIRWRLCLGQDHQFLPLFSHTRKKQQTSREKLHKKGESNETKVNMRWQYMKIFINIIRS